MTVVLGSWLAPVAAQGIYTCTDGQGRRHTSDRPIAECLDREQKELNPSGTVRRKLGPTLTAQERAAKEEKDRQAEAERARLAEEKRRDRALLTRYPNKAEHDKERQAALSQVDEVIKAATRRVGELIGQRKSIDAEFEFYQKDPSKAPPWLKRQVEENEQSLAIQRRFIADQEGEKKRVNARFDEEQVKLKSLWLLQAPAASTEPVKPVSASTAR
ncbi:MAG: DUF4124 domain-containing protein [Burkholderiaceae bacterium]